MANFWDVDKEEGDSINQPNVAAQPTSGGFWEADKEPVKPESAATAPPPTGQTEEGGFWNTVGNFLSGAGQGQLAADEAQALAPLAEQFPEQAVEAVRGDAEFDLPNVNEADLDTLRTGVASMFSMDDDNYADAVIKSHPDRNLTKGQDANGNLMIFENGEPLAYVNQPGLDLEDMTRFGGQAAVFMGPAMAANAVVQGASLPVRMAGMGITEGVADALMQTVATGAAGDVDVDLVQSLIAGGGAAAGEGLLALHRWATTGDDVLSARKILKQLEDQGVQLPKQATDYTDDELRLLSKRLGENPDIGKLDPDALPIVADPNAPDLSRAQMTQDPADFDAQGAATSRDPDLKAAIDEQLTSQQQGYREGISETLGHSGETAVNPTERLSETIRQTSEELEAPFKQAYQEVDEMVKGGAKIDFKPEKLAEVPDLVRVEIPPQALAEADRGSYPALKRVLSEADQLVEGGADVMAVNERIKVIDNIIADLPQGPERRHAEQVRAGLSGWWNDATSNLDNLVLDGADDALATGIKEANELYANWASRFKGSGKENADIYRNLNKVLENNADSAEFVRAVFGGGDIMNVKSPRAIKVIRNALDGTPQGREAFQSMQDMFLDRLTAGNTNNAIAKNIDKVLANNRGAIVELFGDGNKETAQAFIDQLDTMRRVLRQMEPKGDANSIIRRSSGTAERQVRWDRLAEAGSDLLDGGWTGAIGRFFKKFRTPNTTPFLQAPQLSPAAIRSLNPQTNWIPGAIGGVGGSTLAPEE